MKMAQIWASNTPKTSPFLQKSAKIYIFQSYFGLKSCTVAQRNADGTDRWTKDSPKIPSEHHNISVEKWENSFSPTPWDFSKNRNENQKKREKSRNKKAPNLRKLTKRKTEIWSFFDQEENNQEEEKKHQWRMKKTSSLINSPAEVFGLSIPFDLASTSLNLLMICITFTPL